MLRVCPFYSPSPSRCRVKVYLQLRKHSQRTGRVVKTRDMTGSTSFKTDKLLNFPVITPVESAWVPNNSMHGGKVWLKRAVQGAPKYEEFGPKRQKNGLPLEQPKWVGEMRKVFRGVRHNFAASAVFTHRRKQDWLLISANFPWGGLKSVPEEDRPPWSIPEFKPRPVDIGPDLKVGVDPEGRRRPFFKGGKDIAVYKKAVLEANFNHRHLDGRLHSFKRFQEGQSSNCCNCRSYCWLNAWA